MPEEEIRKILDEVSKSPLSDTHCSFDDKLRIGFWQRFHAKFWLKAKVL